jgi:hypothetical protein
MSGAEWATLALGAGGAAASLYTANRNRTQDRELREDENQMTEEQHLRQTALNESLADPFRHQVDQNRALGRLDAITQFQRPTITAPANVAPYMGQVSGGYQPSAQMQDAARKLFGDVASGHTAPSMTDPANYGRTAAVNLGGTPGTPGVSNAPGAGAAGTALPDAHTYLPGQEARRNEGAGGVLQGLVKGATAGGTVASVVPGIGTAVGGVVGGVAGAIAGAFTKNAKTAKTDLSLQQASDAIRQVYESELGRTPSAQEVQGHLVAQGLQPDHKWVGEGGILAVIRNIQNSAEARQRRSAAPTAA